MNSTLLFLKNTVTFSVLLVAGSNVLAQSDSDVRPLTIRFCSKQVAPRMPWQAVRSGTGGKVVAQVRVRYGTVTEVDILSGPELFHNSVANALSHYECEVVADDVVAQQTFVFKMEGEPDPVPSVEPPSFVSSVPDSLSIQRSGELAHIRVLTAFQPVQVDSRTYRSGARSLEFDCKRRRYRIVSAVLHNELNGLGDYAAVRQVDGPMVMLGDSNGENRFRSLACDTPIVNAEVAAAANVSIKLGGHPLAAPVLDRRYEQLTLDDRSAVNAQYEAIAPGDEPPYPGMGLRAIHEALSEAQRSFRSQGSMVLQVKVEPEDTRQPSMSSSLRIRR